MAQLDFLAFSDLILSHTEAAAFLFRCWMQDQCLSIELSAAIWIVINNYELFQKQMAKEHSGKY